MAGDHIEMLRKARERLVADRRLMAAELAEPYAREAIQLTEDQRQRFVTLQQAIEAVDAAIQDERRLKPPDAQQPRWDTVAPDNDPLGN
jgi:acetylornithine/succinyldiaminopimelate/putrescine aminotransferase